MRVAFITNHPAADASSRQRVYQYLPGLRRMGMHVTVHPFSDDSLFEVMRAPGQARAKISGMARATTRRFALLLRGIQADVIFIHREAFPFGPPWIETLVASGRTPVIFSFDDALYAPYPFATSLMHRVLYGLKYGRNLGPVLRRSAWVVAGNRHLAAYAGRHNSRVTVIPTAVDTDLITPPLSRPVRTVTVGWIGGPSTAMHLRSIAPVLRTLAARRPEVNFLFVGDSTLANLGLERSLTRPWALDREGSDLRAMDVGVMPLEDSEWSRGKCAFKAIQYMAAGTAVVASRIGASAEVVEDGVSGLLVKNAADWLDALDRLCGDARMRLSMGKRGRQLAEQHFSLRSTLPTMAHVLTSAASIEPYDAAAHR